LAGGGKKRLWQAGQALTFNGPQCLSMICVTLNRGTCGTRRPAPCLSWPCHTAPPQGTACWLAAPCSPAPSVRVCVCTCACMFVRVCVCVASPSPCSPPSPSPSPYSPPKLQALQASHLLFLPPNYY